MSAALLEARAATIQFGGLKAVDSLSFTVNKGELAGLIGPNGAGKTTVFNLLTGVYQPTAGEILFKGEPINGLRPYQISRKGIARTFQNIRLFKGLTVLDNILIATHQHVTYGMTDSVRLSNAFFEGERKSRDHAMELLRIFKMEGKAHECAASLPYGEQRKLEIVRALATDPQLILLDEPAAGMNHSETHSLMETIAQIRRNFGLTVLLIEHDMKLVMGICERIFVLDHGCKIEEGAPEKIRSSPKVIEAYLGVDAE